jgi:DNA-binding NarL/FixJ family response regulator
MRDATTRGMGDVSAMLRLTDHLPADAPDAVGRKRQLLADMCKLLGDQYGKTPGQDDSISPRMRQTLQMLLDGDSEKQIAHKLSLSKHTVHVYVKALYRHYEVSSRGELLARWVRK